jgi:hypothetical protein
VTRQEGETVEPDAGPAAVPADRSWVAPETPAEPSPSAVGGVADGGGPAAADAPRDAGTARVDPPVPLGPMTVSDILDGSFAIIKRRPRAVLGAAAAFVVPFQVVAVFLQRDALLSGGLFSFFGGTVEAIDADNDTVLLGVIAAALVQSILRFYLGGAVSLFVSGWYAGRDPSGRDAVVGSLKRTGPFLAAWALVLPVKVMSLVFCALVFPPLVVATFFALTAPVIVIEQVGPISAIKRSVTLVARRFWPCLGVVMLSALIELIVQTALAMLPSTFAPLLPAPLDWIVLAAGQAAASMIATTALVGASVLLYIDLRVRSEGLDLEVRAQEVLGTGAA